MFEHVKNETLLWFDKNPLECGLNFELIGMILGLSIYNNVNLDS
jgi:ubiquitin-protein ligase E3 A/E3 ubiquitin-protein ligase HERC3